MTYPTAREVIQKVGGGTRSAGIGHDDEADFLVWSDGSNVTLDSLVAEAIRQERAAATEQFEEIECPNSGWFDHKRNPSKCKHCQGTGKLYRRLQ